MKTALTHEPKSRFTLFYGNRTSPGVMFLEELAAWKDKYLDRLQIVHLLEDEEEEIDLFNGRLDQPKATELLDKLVDVASTDVFSSAAPAR